MSEMLVLATDHKTQKSGAADFTHKLQYLLDEFSVQIIFEEWMFQATGGTAAATLVNSRVPPLPWSNVGTPQSAEYQTLDPIFCAHRNPQFWIYRHGPIGVQTGREQYMLSKIASGMINKKVGLFICGTAHLHSMCEKLRLAGFSVQAFF